LLPPSPDEAGFDSPEDEDVFASPEDEDVEPPDDDEPESDDPPDEPPSEGPWDEPLDALFAALVRDDAPRSFLAQPDPLKWIAGNVNCLRIVPSRPHAGQKTGPGSLIPWRMSARWSQEVQRYS